MSKIVKNIIIIVPILIMGIILITSLLIFNMNKEQTYERIRNLKEVQVQVVASQVDSIIRTTNTPFSEDMDNVYGLQKMIENINEQAGVYCYLFDKDCNLMTGYSKQQKHVVGEEIVKELKEGNLSIFSSNEYNGYITTKINTGEKFLIYWQGVPSGSRPNCEYFIILAVSKEEVQENEAINSCKIMIGVLTIFLTLSIYGNLYINPIFNEEDEEKKGR